MEALKLLRRQVKAMWKLEETLPPAERERHSWQMVANQGGVPYLVGKGGANTFFYKIGDKAKPEFVMPDVMFAILDKWTADKYVMYAITKSAKLSKAKRQSKLLPELQRRLHSKYVGHYIVGFTADGKATRLFSFKTGLIGNEWVPVKA